jgi:hypothetical protein
MGPASGSPHPLRRSLTAFGLALTLVAFDARHAMAQAQDEIASVVETSEDVFEAQRLAWGRKLELRASLLDQTDEPAEQTVRDQLDELAGAETDIWYAHMSLSCNHDENSHGSDEPLYQLNTAGGVSATLKRLEFERAAVFEDMRQAFGRGSRISEFQRHIAILDYLTQNARARYQQILQRTDRQYRVPVYPADPPQSQHEAQLRELRLKRDELAWVIAQQSEAGDPTDELGLEMSVVLSLIDELS